jgi:hypothetical protein
LAVPNGVSSYFGDLPNLPAMNRRLIPFVLFLFAMAPLIAQVEFTNQIQWLSQQGVHSGVAIGVADVNGDGTDDIIRLDQAKNLLIEYQTGEGTFATLDVGQVSGANQWSLCAGDLNNNGFLDVFSGGAYDGAAIQIANADGTIYTPFDMPGPNLFVQGSNFVDINNDGWLDVFACHDDAESRIWANDGTGTLIQADEWIDMATTPPSDNSGNYGSIWTDFDLDGDIDLYIAKCRQGVNNPADPRRINALFENDGNNNFTETSANYGLKIGAQSWTADFNDIDNDGDLDCFITNHDVLSQLLENQDGQFVDITAESGVIVGGLAIQGVMRDFDNDGYMDILVAGTQHFLFLNNGDKTFTEVPNPFDANEMESYAIGDLNQDGFLDIYGGYANIYTNPSNIDDALWINEGNDNNFLTFRLTGTESNRPAIGSRLELYGPWGVQIREVRSGESYGIMNSLHAHFGLGTATEADSVVVYWPSGQTETFGPIPANQFVSIVENSCISPVATISPAGNPALCSGESVTLSAPEGLTYSWSNGATTQSIEVTEPGNYQVTVSDGSGCAGVSAPSKVVVDPVEIPSITVEGQLTFCQSDSINLTASPAISYLWSTGDTTASITINTSGEYFVTTEGQCDFFSSDTLLVEALLIPVPSVESDTLTEPGEATLIADGQEPHWYDAPQGGNLLWIGDTLITPTLSGPTTYYVADFDTLGMEAYSGGQPEHSGASAYSGDQFNGQIIFDCHEPFWLQTVKVYTDTDGERIIQVWDANDQVLHSKEVTIETGEQIVELGFFIEPGVDLKLTTDEANNLQVFGFESPRLQRSSSGVNYPYEIDNLATLKSSQFGEEYYYYFYDWQVEANGYYCFSDRVPAEVVYNPPSVTSYQTPGDLQLFPNPSTGAAQLTWEETFGEVRYLQIFSSTGEEVIYLQLSATQRAVSLDYPNLAAGIYWVRLVGDGQSQTLPWIRH